MAANSQLPQLSDYIDPSGLPKYINAYPTPPSSAPIAAPAGPDYTPRGQGNWLTAGLGAGYHEALGELGSAGEAAGRLVGWQGGADAARQWSDSQRQLAAADQRKDLEDPNTPWYQPSKLGYQLAKSVPSFAAMIAAAPAIAPFVPEGVAGAGAAGLAGLIGREVAPTAIKQGIGAAVAAYPFSVGSNVQRAEMPVEQGGAGEQSVGFGSAAKAAALGVPEAAVFGLPAERFLSKIGMGVEGNIAARVAKGAAGQAAFMAPVSAAQEALTGLMGDPDRTLANRAHDVVQAALGGALQGGVFGGVVGAISRKPEATKPPQDLLNDPDALTKAATIPESSAQPPAPPETPPPPQNTMTMAVDGKTGHYVNGVLVGGEDVRPTPPPPPTAEAPPVLEGEILPPVGPPRTQAEAVARRQAAQAAEPIEGSIVQPPPPPPFGREVANIPAEQRAPTAEAPTLDRWTPPATESPSVPPPEPAGTAQRAEPVAPSAPPLFENRAPPAPQTEEAPSAEYKAPWEEKRQNEKVNATSLVQFIRKMGGIKINPRFREDGTAIPANFSGEIKALIKRYPGLVSKNGVEPDKIREAAAEAGFFGDPELARSNTTGADLFDLLAKDRAYSVHDTAEVQRAQDAADYNRYAAQLKDHADEIQKYADAEKLTVDKRDLVRAAEALHTGEVDHPGDALERAAIEAVERDADIQNAKRMEENGGPENNGLRELPVAGGEESEALARTQGEDARPLDQVAGNPEVAGGPTEAGPEGTRQTLVPGYEPPTQKERVDLAAGKPLRGGNAPLPENSLFVPREPELFAGSDTTPRSPLSEDLTKKVEEGTTQKELLQHIADNHPDPGQAELGRFLLKWGKNEPILNPDGKRGGEEMNDSTGGSASYSTRLNRINFYGDVTPYNVMHEVVHGETAPALDKLILRSALGDATKAELDTPRAAATNHIYEGLKARLSPDDPRLPKNDPLLKDRGLYGLRDVKEFVAEVANPIFRDFLKGEKPVIDGKFANAWMELKNAIFKMLRMPERVRTAYDQVMENLPGLMDESRQARKEGAPNGAGELNANPRPPDEGVKEGLAFGEKIRDALANAPPVGGVVGKAYRALRGFSMSAQDRDNLVHIAPAFMKPAMQKWFDAGNKQSNYSQAETKAASAIRDSNNAIYADKTNAKFMDAIINASFHDIGPKDKWEQHTRLAPDSTKAERAAWEAAGVTKPEDIKAADLARRQTWLNSQDAAELKDLHQKAYNAYNELVTRRDANDPVRKAVERVIDGQRAGIQFLHTANIDNIVRSNEVIRKAVADHPAFADSVLDAFTHEYKAHDDPTLTKAFIEPRLNAKLDALEKIIQPLIDQAKEEKPRGKMGQATVGEVARSLKDNEQTMAQFKNLADEIKNIRENEKELDRVPNFPVTREGEYFVSGRFAVPTGGRLTAEQVNKLRDAMTAGGFGHAVISHVLDNPNIYVRLEKAEQAERLGEIFRSMQEGEKSVLDKSVDVKNGPREQMPNIFDTMSLARAHKIVALMQGTMPKFPEKFLPENIEGLTGKELETRQAELDAFQKGFDAQHAYLINQIRDALPASSMKKILANRKMVQGYSPDYQSAINKRVMNTASAIANLGSSMDRADALTAIRKSIEDAKATKVPMEEKILGQQVAKEVQERDWARQNAKPSPMIDAVRSITHVAEIGLSVPYFLMLHSQLATLVLPELAKRYGTAQSMQAIMRAYVPAIEATKQVLQGKDWKTFGIRDETLKPNGRLTQSQKDHILKQDNMGGFNQSAFTTRDVEGEFPPALEHAIQLGSVMSMVSEQIPRLVSSLATKDLFERYENKRPKNVGLDEHALDVNRQANFGYGPGDSPRLFSGAGPAGNLGKLMFQFMSFPAHLAEKIYREVDDGFLSKPRPGEDADAFKARRDQGRMWLGAHAAATAVLAGSLGLPGPTFAAGVFDKLADWATGEDSWDVQAMYRHWLDQTFTPQVGEVIARGAPRALGFDMARSGESDLPNRILPFMSLLTDKRKFEDRWDDFFRHQAGSAAALGYRSILGARDMVRGDYLKGAIKVLPEIFKGPLEAAQIAERGGYVNGQGQTIPSLHPGAFEIAQAALGMDPAGLADYEEAARSQSGRKNLASEREQNIKQHIVLGMQRGDQDMVSRYEQEARDYQNEHPGLPPIMGEIRGAYDRAARQQAIARATGRPLGFNPRDLEAQGMTFGNFLNR